MRNQIALACILFMISNLNSQSLDLKVYTSAEEFALNEIFKIDWTLGETMTDCNTGPQQKLSDEVPQQQIIVKDMNHSSDNINENIEISIYPNPTSSVLNLKVKKELTSEITIRLSDSKGISVINTILQIGEFTKVIDLNNYPSGNYFLNLTSRDNGLIKSAQIIKLQ